MTKKGFTLIELLIVIGILAILAAATVLILNPAQILQESRDTQRLNDLSTISSGISLYMATVNSPGLGGAAGAACAAGGLAVWRSSNAAAQLLDGQPFQTPATAVASGVTTSAVDGNGWVTVAFTGIAGGSPLSTLPIDPAYAAATAGTGNGLDGVAHYYAYQCSGLTFELNANMESARYSSGGTANKEGTDGGTIGCSGPDGAGQCTQAKADLFYEVGNDPSLDL